MTRPSFLLLIIIPTLLASGSDLPWQNNDELQALLTIKQDWGNPTALRSWKNHNSSNPITYGSSGHCKWVGIACNDNGQVTALSFQNFQIAGPIPASICNLKNLSYIDFSYNNFTREFPTVLYNCSVLQYLDLSNNGFSGTLPAEINKLSSGMEHLILSSNGFTGSVPSGIAGFSKLKSLVLDANSFDGNYPVAISNLAELETLTLASNPFAPGPIPHGFGNLTMLKMLWMSEMNLIGTIPYTLLLLTELTLLDLSQNRLEGSVPALIWEHQKLRYLYLYSNNFTGIIGRNITAINMLELDLSRNTLEGLIPETIGNMKNLTLLYFRFNKFVGAIPRSVGLLPNLQDLRLSYNMLSGPLPSELGKHSPLGNLEVSNNCLTGELPNTLCFNKKLYNIEVSYNNFSGMFPANLRECNMLNNIAAHSNNFVGVFPGSVWSTFPYLTNVTIQNNYFTGVLPAKVSSNIWRIEIGNNRFSGAIPASATGLRVFKAENNWFSHGLPANMNELANLTELSLAGNDISGSIPPSIVALEKLTTLNLSHNRISGAIPTSINQLPMLNSLDLSYNQLIGMVPATIQGPSFNGSFHHNPGLCSERLDPGLSLPLCPGDGSHSSSARRIILLAVLISGVALFGSAIAVVWLVIRRKINKQRDVTSWKMVPFQPLNFTVHEVLAKIREEDVIGRGGSGKVYRIQLGCQGGEEAAAGHSMVAVKKIGNSGKADAGLVKEFDAEVTSLGGLRHSNIINLLCCISGEGTRLLVYEYMENGSLDRWLHRRRHHNADDMPGPLDWPTRLRIAVDVARGLSYMHHDFTRPVIHRDVKCSNILLDCEFRAKIADFGLARTLAKSGESEAASAVCGTFGYIAPEYMNRVKVSNKVDVFSFGVVLLELATGRGPQDGGAESGSCVAKWAAKRYANGEPCVDLVDGEIKDPAYLDDMAAMFELGVVCTGEDPASRPTMSEVLHRLLQCDRSYAMSCDDDDASNEVCGVGSLESIVEMSTMP